VSTATRSLLKKYPASFGILVFTGLFFLSQFIAYERFLLAENEQKRDMNNALNVVKERLDASVKEAVIAAKSMGFIVKKYGIKNDFDDVARTILAENNTVDVLGLMEGEVVTHMYPLKGNEATLGHNFFYDSARSREVKKALEIKDIYFAGPYSLLQGGTGIVGRLPVFRDDRYYGMVTVLIHPDKLIKNIFSDSTLLGKYYFQLSKINPNTGKEQFLLPQPELLKKEKAQSVTIPEGEWKIYIQYREKNIPVSPLLISMLGLLLSAICGAIAVSMANRENKLEVLVEEKVKQLAEKEHSYQSLFRKASDGFVVNDFQGNIIDVNDRMCAITGYSHEELHRMHIAQLIDPDQLKTDPIAYDPVIINSIQIVRSRKIRTKEGAIIEVEINASRISDAEVLIIVRDLTSQRLAEKKIAVSEATLSGAFESSAIGMALVSINGEWIRINRQLCSMLKCAKEELQKNRYADLIMEEDRPTFQAELEKLINGSSVTMQSEHRCRKSNGSYIWVHVSAAIVKDTEGTPIYLVYHVEDIDRQKKNEAEIQERIIQLQNTSNNLPDTMLYQIVRETDGSMHFVYVSDGVVKMTGRRPEEILADAGILFSRVHPDDVQFLLDAQERSYQSMELFDVEIRFYLPDGQLRIMNIRSVPRRLPDGRVLWDGLQFDITDRKNAEKEITKLNRLYQFISQINALVLRAEDRDIIFSEACRIAVHYGNFRMAFIGKYSEEKKQVVPLATAGYEEGYLQQIRITADKSPTSEGPSGKAIRNHQHYYCNNIETDNAMLPWREEALKRNYRSSIALPVIVEGKVDVIFTLYMSEINFFNETEIKLLLDVTENVAQALDKIRIRELKTEAEDNLRRSEEINRAIVTTFPDKIFRISKDGMVLAVHSSHDTDFYVAPDEVTGKKLIDALPENASSALMGAIRDAAGTRKLVTVEYTLEIAGSLRYLEGRVIAMSGDEFMLIVRDMTEPREAAAALERSVRETADYRYAIDESSYVDISDKRGVIIYANENFCKVTGYKMEELIGMDHRLLNSGFHPRSFFSGLWNTVLHGKVWRGEIRERTKHGTFFWVDTTIVPFLDQGGKPYQFVSIRKDITDRKKSEAELIESEEKFRKLVEQSMVGVFILSRNHFVYVNPGFERISGFTEAQLLAGITFDQLLHLDDIEKVYRSGQPGTESDNLMGHKLFRMVRMDGKILYIESVVSEIIYAGEKAIISTVIDISDRMEEERKIKKAITDAQEQERNQIGMELHDNVQQLLAASQITLDMAKMKVDLEHAAVRYIDMARNNLSNATIEVRRLSHQLAPLMKADIPLSETLLALVHDMNITARLPIQLIVDPEVENVKQDIKLTCYRIVQEQLNNIFKYAKPNKVLISVSDLGQILFLQIKDDGVGFDIREVKGGIGLTNIRRRVDLLNGEMQIITSPGEGCEIIIRIPLMA
jgi:PAS domain S-box-containing protein